MLSRVEEIVALRRRLEAVEEENRYLKDLLRPDLGSLSRARLGLQPQEWVMLQALMAASPKAVSYEQIIARIETRSENPLGLVKMRLFTLRKKMCAHGVTIGTIYGEAMFIDAENKQRLAGLLEMGQ